MGRLSKHPRGYATWFKNPRTGQKERGEVIDEVWVRDPEQFEEVAPDDNDGWNQGAFVAQLIEWGPNNRRIRIAYYTRRPGGGPKDWVFAQFAPSMSLEECGALFRGMQEEGWFEGHPD